MDFPETSVTTCLRCATSQNSEDLKLRSSPFYDPRSTRQVMFLFRHKAASYLGWSEHGFTLRNLGFNPVDFMSNSWRRNTAPGVSRGSFAFPLQTIIQPLLYTNLSYSTTVRDGPDQAAYLLLKLRASSMSQHLTNLKLGDVLFKRRIFTGVTL
jgi:hypothetical protein